MTIEFKAWPKTTRLESKVTVSEKANGSNGAVIVVKELLPVPDYSTGLLGQYYLGAQSRTQLATVKNDQVGIAQWVVDNAMTLALDLGEGHHYGEFMTRGHDEPHFYLFNTKRWSKTKFLTPTLKVVPVLYEGDYYEGLAQHLISDLIDNGSRIHPGIPAEGIVLYWHGDQTMKKFYTGLVRK